MKKQKLVIIGGHGDGLVALEIAKSLDMFDFVGFLNDGVTSGESIYGYPVLGKTTDWDSLDNDVLFHVSLHKVGDMPARSKLIELLKVPLSRLCNLIHQSSYIPSSVELGKNILIASHVTLQPNVRLDHFTTVRAGANVGHDVKVGEYCYIGPNSTICGNSNIGIGVHISPNAVVIDHLSINDFTVIGAGAAVFKDTVSNSTWLGNPARRVK